jgi:hypothetical protein
MMLKVYYMNLKFKKMFLTMVFVLISCFLLIGQNVVAVSSASSQLDFSILRYEPMPAEPGKFVTIYVKVENMGLSDSNEISVTFVDTYPFKIVNEEDRVKTVGSLGVSDKTKTKVIEYRVFVDNNAVEGVNYIKLNYAQVRSSNLVFEEELAIDVQKPNKLITVNSVESKPKYAAPGKPIQLFIEIENIQSSNLYDLLFSLDLTDITVPFLPFQSVPEVYLNKLDFNGKTVLEFNLMAEPNAVSGLYKIPLNVAYKDSTGSLTELSYITSLAVNDEPNYIFNLRNAPFIVAGERGDIVVSFSNVGTSEIKFLNIELMDTDDYVVLSNPKDYIGNIRSDDFETSDFNIKVDKNFNLDKVPLKLKLNYADSFNNNIEDEIVVDMRVYTLKELNELGIRNGSSQNELITSLMYSIPIVILLLSFFVFMLADAITSTFKKKYYKVMWIVILVTTHVFGAIVYFFARKGFKKIVEDDE